MRAACKYVEAANLKLCTGLQFAILSREQEPRTRTEDQADGESLKKATEFMVELAERRLPKVNTHVTRGMLNT